jgi:hypothetical protein
LGGYGVESGLAAYGGIRGEAEMEKLKSVFAKPFRYGFA